MEMGSLHVRCGNGIEVSFSGGGVPTKPIYEMWRSQLPKDMAVISWDGWVLAPISSTA